MNTYINPTGGIAGDMFTAALLSLGASQDKVLSHMQTAARQLGEADIQASDTKEGGKRLHIHLQSRHAHLEAEEGREILQKLFTQFQTSQPYRDLGMRIYQILLDAERQAHSENIFSGDHYHVSPIGAAHSPYTNDAPFQPDPGADGDFYIRIFPEYRDGLHQLSTFSHIMAIAYLDRAQGYALRVTPPWQDKQVGLFATRSPHRPNPLGFNVLQVKSIQDGIIYTSPFDYLNNTPILDIKPALGRLDKIEDANNGWVKDRDPTQMQHSHAPGHGRQHSHTHGHGHHHGNQTFLHEAQDIIIDIIGAITALEDLSLPTTASLTAPVSVGGGTVTFSHGHLDVPAPATKAIFQRYNIPWEHGSANTELCTPTGAAILAALQATSPQQAPSKARCGTSRGAKDLPIPPLKLCIH